MSHRSIAAAGLMMLCAASIAAQAQPLATRPVDDVQAYLGQLLDCRWEGTTQVASCTTKALSGRLFLTKDASGKFVETIEFMILSSADPKASPKESDVTVEMMTHLFPAWKESSQWTGQAVHDVFKGRRKHVIKVDGETILIESHEFADVDGTFARVVITKKSSVDEYLEPSD